MSAADTQLLSQYAATGDADSFAELIARHRDMVYSATARMLPEPADAEDATQEAFLRLASNADRVRTSVGAWLHRTAVNAALDAHRKDRSHRAREREAAAMAVNEQGEASWGELKDEVDRAIDSLPDKLRQPVVLHYLEGKTQTAVARELGLSQATVSGRVGQGIEQLRLRLKRAGIAVSAAALAGLLSTHAVQAAPTAVAADLAKLALAGFKPSAASASGAAALGGKLSAPVATKVVCGMLAVWVGGVGVHQLARQYPDSPWAPWRTSRNAHAWITQSDDALLRSLAENLILNVYTEMIIQGLGLPEATQRELVPTIVKVHAERQTAAGWEVLPTGDHEV